MKQDMAGVMQTGEEAAGGQDGGEAFVVVRPAAPGRFVFASPHSGVVYPADMEADPALPETSLRSAEDALVDRLIASGADHGAALLLARIGRAYVDLNRDPGDLDSRLIDGLPAGPVLPRTAAGYGVIPRLSGDGRPLHARTLTRVEAAGRIARVHAPWHEALDGLMAAAHSRHGSAVLIDWHSMPAHATGSARGLRGPDVVLGDRHGSACSAGLTRRVRRLFEDLGWRVALNVPYAGGWTTQRWGRPAEGFHALQIELNRALYFDEAARTRGPGWSRAEKGVVRVIAELLSQPL